MEIEFDLKSRESDIAGAVCENCQEEWRQRFLRIISVEIKGRSLGQFILCVKCLAKPDLSMRAKWNF